MRRSNEKLGIRKPRIYNAKYPRREHEDRPSPLSIGLSPVFNLFTCNYYTRPVEFRRRERKMSFPLSPYPLSLLWNILIIKYCIRYVIMIHDAACLTPRFSRHNTIPRELSDNKVRVENSGELAAAVCRDPEIGLDAEFSWAH